VLLLAHFISTIPQTSVTINVQAYKKGTALEYVTTPPYTPEIKVTMTQLTFPQFEEEKLLFKARKCDNSLEFFVDPLISSIYSLNTEKIDESTTTGEILDAHMLLKLKSLRESPYKYIIPSAVSTSAEVGIMAGVFLLFLEKIAKLKGFVLPSLEFIEKLSLTLETSRATMLKMYNERLKAMEGVSRVLLSTSYSLPPEFPRDGTKLEKFIFRQRYNSVWTNFLTSFVHIPPSITIVSIPRHFLLQPVPDTLDKVEKDEREFTNHLTNQQSLLCSYSSTFSIPKKTVEFIDLTKS
jgi:hypothetical protein